MPVAHADRDDVYRPIDARSATYVASLVHVRRVAREKDPTDAIPLIDHGRDALTTKRRSSPLWRHHVEETRKAALAVLTARRGTGLEATVRGVIESVIAPTESSWCCIASSPTRHPGLASSRSKRRSMPR